MAQSSKLANLPAAGPLTGSELLYAVQSGADVQTTTSQVGAIALAVYPFAAQAGNDIGAALNTFMSNVAALGGGLVQLPPGNFNTSVQIVVPTQVQLNGAGKRVTQIFATGSFPTNTAMVRLGRISDGPIINDCTLNNLQLQCANISGSIGVYSNSGNEGCGCNHVITENWADTGIFYDIGCEHFINYDIESLTNHNPSNYCIKFNGSNEPITFVQLSLNGAGVGNTLAGLRATGSSFIIANAVHVENCTDGLLFDSASVTGVVSYMDAESITNCVHFSAAASVTVINATTFFGGNPIKYDPSSLTITTSPANLIAGGNNIIATGANSVMNIGIANNANYNQVSLNGLNSGSLMGLEGGATGDKNLYINVPASGGFVFQTNGGTNLDLNVTNSNQWTFGNDLVAGAQLYTSSTSFVARSKGTLTNNAASQTATLTNGPTAGNPTKWIAIDDNGTTRFIPAW